MLNELYNCTISLTVKGMDNPPPKHNNAAEQRFNPPPHPNNFHTSLTIKMTASRFTKQTFEYCQ